MIPLSPSFRMVKDDPSYVTMQQVYEDWCRKTNNQKDDPVLYQIEKLRALSPKTVDHMNAVRLETFMAITETMVPNTVLLDYFQDTYKSFSDFWLFRRTFAYQYAAVTFTTYIMFMNARHPHKFHIARSSGTVWASEMVPSMGAQRPIFNNPESVPFRLTPNIQMLLSPIITEGIFAPALMTLARALIEPEGEMEMELALFLRDEVIYWFSTQRQSQGLDGALREAVAHNSDMVRKRAASLANAPEAANLPAFQTVVDLVATASNPKHLSSTEALWMAWL